MFNAFVFVILISQILFCNVYANVCGSPAFISMWWMHWFFCSESRARGVAATAIVTFCSLWPLSCVKYLTYLTCFHCVWICPSLTPPGVRKLSFTSNRFRLTGAGGRGLRRFWYCLSTSLMRGCRSSWEPPPWSSAECIFSYVSHLVGRGDLSFVCVCVGGNGWCLTECFFPTRFFLCDRYRFAEIRYHRPEETHKGRTVPAHVETVVLFLPDVWHCLPTRSEWEGLSCGLKEQLAEKLLAERKEADGEQALNANPSLLISASHRHRNRQTKHSENTERNRQVSQASYRTHFYHPFLSSLSHPWPSTPFPPALPLSRSLTHSGRA